MIHTYSYLNTDSGLIFEVLYAGIIEANIEITIDSRNIAPNIVKLMGIVPICSILDIPRNAK